jgi:hypothetical protein
MAASTPFHQALDAEALGRREPDQQRREADAHAACRPDPAFPAGSALHRGGQESTAARNRTAPIVLSIESSRPPTLDSWSAAVRPGSDPAGLPSERPEQVAEAVDGRRQQDRLDGRRPAQHRPHRRQREQHGREPAQGQHDDQERAARRAYMSRIVWASAR